MNNKTRASYEVLDRVLHPANGSRFCDSTFFRLGGAFLIANNSIRTRYDPESGQTLAITDSELVKKFYPLLLIVMLEVETLFVMCDKVDYLAARYIEHDLEPGAWHDYIKVDIHSFHSELRSLYDSIAKLIKPICKKPGQVSDSFNWFRQQSLDWSPLSCGKVGAELLRLIRQCDDFEQNRNIRDSILHYGRDVEVKLLLPTDIIFQLSLAKGELPSICSLDSFMWRGWVLLRPYIGYHLASLIDLLNKVSDIAVRELDVPLLPPIFKWKPGRESSAIAWMQEAHDRLHCVLSARFAYEKGWERIFNVNKRESEDVLLD